MISVGMDISKGKSMVCIRETGGGILAEPYEVEHSEQGLAALVDALCLWQKQDEVKVVMEATGVYHLPVLMRLKEAGFFVCVVNPLAMKKYVAQSLRRGKNDRQDALKIAAFGLEKWYFMEDYTPTQDVYEDLRLLGRQYMHYVTVKVSCKQNLSCLLERTMPGIVTLLDTSHTALGGKSKLLDFVETYWHYDNITRMSLKAFITHYNKWARKYGYHQSEAKAREIYTLAVNGVPTLDSARPSCKLLMKRALHALREISDDASQILLAMQELAQQLPEYSVIREMQGVGDVLAPRLIAEIGDIRRFHSAGALIAYAGIDSPEFQSGAFAATTRRISKRGSSLLRKTGYEVMQSLKRIRAEDNPIYQYMLKKEREGKHKKVAKIAGLNKFLRIYYARVKECLLRQNPSFAARFSPLAYTAPTG